MSESIGDLKADFAGLGSAQKGEDGAVAEEAFVRDNFNEAFSADNVDTGVTENDEKIDE